MRSKHRQLLRCPLSADTGHGDSLQYDGDILDAVGPDVDVLPSLQFAALLTAHFALLDFLELHHRQGRKTRRVHAQQGAFRRTKYLLNLRCRAKSETKPQDKIAETALFGTSLA